MDESYNNNVSSTSHLLGSVPAVVSEEKKATNFEVPEANLQIFPPANGGGSSRQGYQTLGTPTEGFEQQPANNWNGVFSISSYTQYFNVGTDDVVTRILSSLYPGAGDFSAKSKLTLIYMALSGSPLHWYLCLLHLKTVPHTLFKDELTALHLGPSTSAM